MRAANLWARSDANCKRKIEVYFLKKEEEDIFRLGLSLDSGNKCGCPEENKYELSVSVPAHFRASNYGLYDDSHFEQQPGPHDFQNLSPDKNI